MTLQRALNDTAHRLSVRAPIVAMPGLLKLTLDLGFRLDCCNDLGMGLHQFGLGQHTSATQKVLKVCANQNQVIVVSGAAPSLSDADTPTAPDGVSLMATISVARGYHA